MGSTQSADTMNLVFYCNRVVRVLCRFIRDTQATPEFTELCAELVQLFEHLGSTRPTTRLPEPVRRLATSGAHVERFFAAAPIHRELEEEAQKGLKRLAQLAEIAAEESVEIGERKAASRKIAELFDKLGNNSVRDMMPAF